MWIQDSSERNELLFPAAAGSIDEVAIMIDELGTLIIGDHYLSLMLILILSCILLGRNMLSKRVRQGNLWVTVIACALLVVQDIVENYSQLDPARRILRTLSSVDGYSLRPIAVLGFLLAVWPLGHRSWYLWIPIVLNTLLYHTAFFMPLAFWFDENYSFQRGPLNGSAFCICIIYLVLTLFVVHRRFRDRRAGDLLVLYLCTLGTLASAVLDIFFSDGFLVPAILVSSLTFYLFVMTQDSSHDSLTGLWNRATFYEDCRKMKNVVTAVASIDMNGLKKINDEEGHEAGDRALKMISRILHSSLSRNGIAYRIGGDEFMALFVHCGEADIQQALSGLREEVQQMGLSVSVGVALRQEAGDSLDELIRISDMRMYEDKRSFYQAHDRRRRG